MLMPPAARDAGRWEDVGAAAMAEPGSVLGGGGGDGERERNGVTMRSNEEE